MSFSKEAREQLARSKGVQIMPKSTRLNVGTTAALLNEACRAYWLVEEDAERNYAAGRVHVANECRREAQGIRTAVRMMASLAREAGLESVILRVGADLIEQSDWSTGDYRVPTEAERVEYAADYQHLSRAEDHHKGADRSTLCGIAFPKLPNRTPIYDERDGFAPFMGETHTGPAGYPRCETCAAVAARRG